MIRYRYSAWDGSQDVFHPGPEDVLKSLADYLLQGGDLQKALRMLMQRGMTDRHGQVMPGLQDILRRLRAMKEQQLRQYNPNSALDDLRRRLDDIVARERQALDAQLEATRQRLDGLPTDTDPETAQQRANEARAVQEMEELVAERRAQLDALPRDVGDTIRGLQQYDFIDQQARADFAALLQSLQQQAMDSLWQSLTQRLHNMTSADMQRMRHMLEDLNRLLEQRAWGEEGDFHEFLNKHRDLFPDGAPGSLEALLEQLAHNMQAMQSLLNSLSDEKRQELQRLMQQVFGDEQLQQAMAELMQHLQDYMQQEGLGERVPFQGDAELPLQEALRLIQRLQGMEQLEDTLERVLWGGIRSRLMTSRCAN